MSRATEASGILQFGRFTVVPLRRELLVDGVAIELGSRAFDVLLALIEGGGTVLSKDDLIGRVWSGQIVEENNLQVQIAALRKALAEDRDLIRTVPGRGYQFTGEVGLPGAPIVTTPPSSPTNLPRSASELIGRETELGEVTQLITAQRLVTLIGAGGIGKTRLSVEAGYGSPSWVPSRTPPWCR